MSQIITFTGYTPAARFDAVAWTHAQVYEGPTSEGPWMLIDTLNLLPVDADPTEPETRNLTTEQASDAPDLWYRLVFTDNAGASGQPTAAIQNTTPTADSYATVGDVLARLGRYSGVVSSSGSSQHPNTDDISQILGDVTAELNLAFVALGHDPDTFDAKIQGALKDLTAFGAISRLLAGVPQDNDLEQLAGYATLLWEAAMGDPSASQVEAIEGSIAFGTHPVVRALRAGEDGLSSAGGDFFDDEPEYGTPMYWLQQRILLAEGALSPSLLPTFFKNMSG